MKLSDIIQNGWNLLGIGDFDALVKDYADNMIFIMPGQDNILEGKGPFREALSSLGQILPPGFEITGLRNLEGENEVVSILEWKSDKVSSSQLSVLFKFEDNKIYEERWFIDTEQWKNAF
ncbi:nuclear transport factor 2 family protein [Porticoccaceae bacterium LTM1]|nr:nuclear transport factor 2 family protein [Porticoccaceae bacterium LTM1]